VAVSIAVVFDTFSCSSDIIADGLIFCGIVVLDSLWLDVRFGWNVRSSMSLFSIIVLGIGERHHRHCGELSVCIFLDHIRDVHDRKRGSSGDDFRRFFIGNITTVAAFLCLILAGCTGPMRDLGFVRFFDADRLLFSFVLVFPSTFMQRNGDAVAKRPLFYKVKGHCFTG
jgi:hypothetical protein